MTKKSASATGYIEGAVSRGVGIQADPDAHAESLPR
jgi:hypothetical protein